MDTPIDVDEDSQWKHDSEFVKIVKNMYDTCGTRVWLTLSTSMSMTWSLLRIWDHPQSISLEKLDIKHVPYMFLMIFDELAVVLSLVVFVDVDGGVHDAKSGSNLF